MSYQTIDHAAWVENNNAARRSTCKKSKPTAYGEARGHHAAPKKLNRFQARVMDICGMVFSGIYNAPISWNTTRWNDTSVSLPLAHMDFSTHDFGALMRLVLLCAEARIRASISPHGRGLMLSFHQRSHDGGNSDRHPNIDEAVEGFRTYLPEGHRVTYRPDLDDPLPARRREHLETLAGILAPKLTEEVISLFRSDPGHSASRLTTLQRYGTDARRIAEQLGGGPDVTALADQVAAQAARAGRLLDGVQHDGCPT